MVKHYVNFDTLKNAVALTFWDKCTVTRQNTRTNITTHVEEAYQEVLYLDIPCKISYRNISNAAQSNADGSTNSASKQVTLFTASEIDIPSGCTITVNMGSGDVIELERSGIPACYATHKEYNVVQVEDYL